ncbi:histidine triad nucleotide-binding protein 3-like isoform X1 [Frieseomelitta varia]|uniref:histidine triad nucleotide-binding protein 3-like isoform X1 n=1 Tax=Frieseomelitta varia TaxID=561572 RepID=UPI001CB6A6A4|nr:histidine triad nucleotide-binding protein 3-like isoform X1 [Frieseomelitta varia]
MRNTANHTKYTHVLQVRVCTESGHKFFVKVPKEKIRDDYVTCIKDINPASTHHYLILPNKHINNAKELCSTDDELYDRILSTVDIIAEQQGLDLTVTRTGFHWPPFNTISHLHLHVISPICNINFFKKFIFKPNSYWFVSTDYVKSYLKNRK